jgi:hypothetical protein
MSPTRRKAARTTTKGRQAKSAKSRQETILSRVGLVKSASLSNEQRQNLAKLTIAEVRALVSVKRKLRYPGSILIRGFIF